MRMREGEQKGTPPMNDDKSRKNRLTRLKLMQRWLQTSGDRYIRDLSSDELAALERLEARAGEWILVGIAFAEVRRES